MSQIITEDDVFFEEDMTADDAGPFKLLPESSTGYISPVEAALVAEWFCRCVDLGNPASIQVGRPDVVGPYAQNGATYSVNFAWTDINLMGSVRVDAVSGDVTHAQIGSNSAPLTRLLPTVTGQWLTRLGRGNDFVWNANYLRYELAPNGHRFCNLNGNTSINFLTNDGPVLTFHGVGIAPSLPETGPNLSRETATELGQNFLAQLRGAHHGKLLVPEAELVLFYDDESKCTRWLWEVVQREELIAGHFGTQTCHLDGLDGSIVPRERIHNSSFRYVPRELRAGLSHIGGESPLLRKLELARKKLIEIGHADFTYDYLEVEAGIVLRAWPETNFVMYETGRLRTFKAVDSLAPASEVDLFELSQVIIRQECGPLPEGNFEPVRPYQNEFSRVRYRQTALGYPYLGEALATVVLNRGGEIVNFDALLPKSAPDFLPTQLLDPDPLIAARIDRLKQRLFERTPGARITVRPRLAELGWWSDPELGNVRLGYEVVLAYSVERGMENPGSEVREIVDAETGNLLGFSYRI